MRIKTKERTGNTMFTTYKNKKLKTSDETVRRMHKLSKRGVGDKEIARRMGVSTNVVVMSLARVAPDGRIMRTMYGDRKNDPTYQRPGPPAGLEELVLGGRGVGGHGVSRLVAAERRMA